MNATTHPVASEEVMALVDGQLPADKAQSISAHIESCIKCHQLAASLRSTSHRLRNWTIQSVSPEFDGALAEAASSVCSAPWPAVGLRWVPYFRRHWILTAASLAFATGVFLMFSMTAPRLAKTPPPPAYSHGVDLARANDRISSQDLYALQERMPTDKDRFRSASGSDGRPGTVGRLETETRAQLKQEPMIARTVALSLIAKDFSASRASLDAILTRHHGYVAGLTVDTEQDAARSLKASLRIPAGELNAIMLDLKSLGRVQNESQNGQEVTQQHADLVARLKNSRETEARLQDILRNRTGKISDVLAVEQEIERVRGEIEQMEAEQKSLEHRVDFVTIDLQLSEEYKAHLDSPSPSVATRFHNALVSGYRAGAETVIGILLFFAEIGPSLLLWLLIFLPLPWLLWRRWRRSVMIASSAS